MDGSEYWKKEAMRLKQQLMAAHLMLTAQDNPSATHPVTRRVEGPDDTYVQEGPEYDGDESDSIERYIMDVLEQSRKQRQMTDTGLEPSVSYAGDSGLVERTHPMAQTYRDTNFGYDEEEEELRMQSRGPSRRARVV
jgi:hypothetical protein